MFPCHCLVLLSILKKANITHWVLRIFDGHQLIYWHILFYNMSYNRTKTYQSEGIEGEGGLANMWFISEKIHKKHQNVVNLAFKNNKKKSLISDLLVQSNDCMMANWRNSGRDGGYPISDVSWQGREERLRIFSIRIGTRQGIYGQI